MHEKNDINLAKIYYNLTCAYKELKDYNKVEE